MSSAENKAVFLSYASQDAEAVAHIAEALRAAGVEVWFDKDELVGGDAWDQKIRRQIKECALFVPVTSAATQARTEGYFRLEWRLADQRTHLMAKGRPFLLPVVIDDTRDAEAHVPDSFSEVQWTRLPGGDTPAAFCARVKKLLGQEGVAEGPVGDRAPEHRSGLQAERRPTRPWLVPAIIGAAAVVALAVWQPWRATEKPTPPASSASTAAPLTEARKLVAQARALFEDGDDANHENLFLAEDLLKKAQALDATDGEVWAAHAQLSTDIYTLGYDRALTRREAWRTQAERAIKLAPDSIESQVAYAGFLAWSGKPSAQEAVRQLEKTAERAPNHRRLYRVLGFANGYADRWEDALAAFERAGTIGGGDPGALLHKVSALDWLGRYEEAERTVQRAQAIRATGRGLVWDVFFKLTWRGDLEGAALAVERWPAWLLLEQRGAFMASQVWFWRREPDKAIAVLAPIARDYFTDTFFTGPKSGLLALAHEMAGRKEAAGVEWENARRVAERVTAEDPTARRTLAWRGSALARAGNLAEAERILRDLEQTKDLFSEFWSCAAPSALLRIATGHGDEVMKTFDSERRSAWLNRGTPVPQAALRLNPVFDPIRAKPEFQKWMAGAPAPEEKKETKVSAAPAPTVNEKSVAVLAFDNRSDDKEAEYFSDGISEELLNALGRVPGLTVKGRTSAFSFKGKNVTAQEIGEKLGVTYLVRGSVRKAGDKVRITAQLSRAATDEIVWSSESFERELKDVFAVTDEISKNILTAVKGRLMGDAELPHAATTKIEAYTLYLQAQGALAKRGDANLREAIRLFEAALSIDANYVPALIGLGQARAVVPLYANLSGAKARVMIDSAMAAAKRALELDARNPAAHAIIGWLLVQYEWKWSEGEAAVLRALELAPNDPWIWNSLGDHYRFVGEFAKGIAAKQRAWELDPLSPVSQWDLGYANLVAGNFDQALHWSEVCVGLAPHTLDSYTPGIMAACQSGRTELMRKLVTAARQNVHENEGLLLLLEARTAIQEKKPDEARRLLKQAIPLAETGDTTPAFIGYCYLLLGDADQAAMWLQRAYEQRDSTIVWNELIDLDVIAANPKTRSILDRPGIKELYELRQRNARGGAGKI